MSDDRIAAAGRVIHKAGQQRGWSGFNVPFDELDPIAQSEFLAIVEQALRAADAVSPDFSKLKYEQPLPAPNAYQRARDDADALAPFRQPDSSGTGT